MPDFLWNTLVDSMLSKSTWWRARELVCVFGGIGVGGRRICAYYVCVKVCAYYGRGHRPARHTSQLRALELVSLETLLTCVCASVCLCVYYG